MRFCVFVASLVVILTACCTSFASAENVVLVNNGSNDGRRLRSEAANTDIVSKNVATFTSKLTKKVQAKKNAASLVTELQKKVQASKNAAKFIAWLRQKVELEKTVPLAAKVYADEAAVKALFLTFSGGLDKVRVSHKNVANMRRNG
ncbi:hypothetical protein PI124_g7465 [Phytophthora idaei]|nr:hypothetical protein PI125_g16394 [Phytophthora idaei]KAG3137530.1 hypothetical protein PI126_g17351 [Phytophthora idaei]KAG3247821.1 hypothetical protein PI124_g7465 [Phytophthora idaei]